MYLFDQVFNLEYYKKMAQIGFSSHHFEATQNLINEKTCFISQFLLIYSNIIIFPDYTMASSQENLSHVEVSTQVLKKVIIFVIKQYF